MSEWHGTDRSVRQKALSGGGARNRVPHGPRAVFVPKNPAQPKLFHKLLEPRAIEPPIRLTFVEPGGSNLIAAINSG